MCYKLLRFFLIYLNCTKHHGAECMLQIVFMCNICDLIHLIICAALKLYAQSNRLDFGLPVLASHL